jgi:hypothetical protein
VGCCLLVFFGCQDGSKILPKAARPPDAGNGAPVFGDASGAPVFGNPVDARSAPDVGPEPSCAADSFKAERLPLDLLLLLDRSGSMADAVTAGGKRKWQLAQEALVAFLADPGSAGLGVGLQLFPPDGRCNSDADCGIPFPLNLTDFACVEPLACAPIAGALPASCDFPGDRVCGTGTCETLGRCSVSGGFCTGLGRPCAGTTPNDTCVSTGKSCQLSLAPEVCDANAFATPLVPFADLPGAAPALTYALGRAQPGGQTPTASAVAGALAHLRARLTAQPGRRVALVLITDGLPTSCGSTVAGVTNQVATASSGMPPISTYAIGVFGATDALAGRMALTDWAIHGGSGAPFVLSPADDLTQKLLEALNQIRGAALPCAYAIPRPTAMGNVDFNRLNLHYQPSAGGPGEDVVYVGSAAKCDPGAGGWYYDVPPETGTPTQVLTCDATCRKFKQDASAQVALRLGCKTRVIE